MSEVRIEDHHKLLAYVMRLHMLLEIENSSALWRHKENISSLSTLTIRGNIYEKYSFAGYEGLHERFNDFILSSYKHKRTNLS